MIVKQKKKALLTTTRMEGGGKFLCFIAIPVIFLLLAAHFVENVTQCNIYGRRAMEMIGKGP